MKRQIITTGDGSKTIQIEEWNEQYHSVHGAIQEAKHVFLKHGLHYFIDQGQVVNDGGKTLSQNVSILEIGFGTGLNAFLTLLESRSNNLLIDYVGIEAYPVSETEISELNYPDQLQSEKGSDLFERLHQVSWEKPHLITSGFQLTKIQKFFHQITFKEIFNIIYFDAFGSRVQPELWTESIFEIMFLALKSGGVLVTYSAKGSVRRAMQAVGFLVEKLPGPPGKREMLRAVKPFS